MRCVDWETEFRKGKLGLSGLLLQISDLGVTVNLLHDIVRSEYGDDPTRLLGIIYEVEERYMHQSGTREVCQALREAAFEPIGSILVDFLLRGDISGDVFGEFFVTRSNDNFVLVERRQVPPSLSHMTENIVSAGTSACLLARMGVDVMGLLPEIVEEMRVKPVKLLDSFFCTVAVREARSTLNSQLLAEVNRGDSLKNEIALFKRYFFISESDWYLELLFLVLPELEKPVKTVNRVRLNEAIKTVSKGKVLAHLHKFPLEAMRDKNESEDLSMLTVRALTVSRKPGFPLNVIFTESVMFKFQCVFRHIFFCKYIETKLGELWSEFHSLHSLEANESLLACHFLLQRMLHFVKNYLIHLSVDVIESKDWESVLRAKSVFQVEEELETKLTSVIEEMGITSSSLYKSVNKVFSTCGLFSAHMTRFVHILLSQSEDRLEQAMLIENASREDKYLTLISKFQDAYDGQANSVMVQLKKQEGKAHNSLMARLDFNQYFSHSMGI